MIEEELKLIAAIPREVHIISCGGWHGMPWHASLRSKGHKYFFGYGNTLEEALCDARLDDGDGSPWAKDQRAKVEAERPKPQVRETLTLKDLGLD